MNLKEQLSEKKGVRGPKGSQQVLQDTVCVFVYVHVSSVDIQYYGAVNKGKTVVK